MRTPNRLAPLMDAHMIDQVVGQLQSGKEADLFVVISEGEYRCAKVYKDATNRSFKQKSDYTEGRSVRNSRQARAMNKNSKFGRQEREREWQTAEVEALAMLASAGVKVPVCYGMYEGVLLLQMIVDKDGNPAPRLSEVRVSPDVAKQYFAFLVREMIKMLCAGYVHGDLSEFNILVSKDGLVIIDLPQVVQATSNNAFVIFERDLKHLTSFFGKVSPEILRTDYANEIWNLFKNGKLKPDSVVTGQFKKSGKQADVQGVLAEIDAAREEAMKKLERNTR